MLSAKTLPRWPHRFRVRYPGGCLEFSTHPDAIGIGVYRLAHGTTHVFLGSLIRGALSTPPGLTDIGIEVFNAVVGATWAGNPVPEPYAVEVIEGPCRPFRFLLIQDGVKSVAESPDDLDWAGINDCAGFTVAIGADHEVLATIAEVQPIKADVEAWRVTSVMDGNNRLVGGYETPGPFVRSRLTAIWRAGWLFDTPPCLTIREG